LSFGYASSDEQLKFVNALSSELAQCVPVPSQRLFSNVHYQWDPEVDSKQILLKFKIIRGKAGEMSANTIIDTLDTMIKNGDITLISQLPNTSKLDSAYGFKHKSTYYCYVI